MCTLRENVSMQNAGAGCKSVCYVRSRAKVGYGYHPSDKNVYNWLVVLYEVGRYKKSCFVEKQDCKSYISKYLHLYPSDKNTSIRLVIHYKRGRCINSHFTEKQNCKPYISKYLHLYPSDDFN